MDFLSGRLIDRDNLIVVHYDVTAFKATDFGEITQNNGRQDYAVQSHSRSPILVPIESPYIRLPISENSNLAIHPISHRIHVIADYLSNLRFL